MPIQEFAEGRSPGPNFDVEWHFAPTRAERWPRQLLVVLSPEEVARLLDAAPGLKYKAALSVADGAGLRASEIISLKIGDIDSAQMVIRVEQGKGR